jgi:putative aminopeptidase FrvX
VAKDQTLATYTNLIIPGDWSDPGVVTGVSICYPHSVVQIYHSDDIIATLSLLVKFLEGVHEFFEFVIP